MSIVQFLLKRDTIDSPSLALNILCGLIGYGQNRKDGGHDHRYNRGKDRTEAQRKADQRRRK